MANTLRLPIDGLKRAMSDGKSVREIAQEFGVHEISVRMKLSHLKMSANATERCDAPAKMEDVEKLLAEGMTLKAVANKLGVNYNALHAYCSRRGVSSRSVLPEQDIVDAYLKGTSSKELSVRYKSSVTRILNVVRKNGHDVRKRGPEKMKMPDMGPIVQRYFEGESASEIAKSVGVQHHMVEKWLKRESVEMRGTKAWRNLNETYFDVVSTEEQSYWIGFLGADGWVLEDGLTIGVALKESDEEHVKKFAKAIQLDVERVKKRTGRDEVQLIFKSVKMWSSLKKYGIGPRKSENYDPIIPVGFETAFWRGMVDGDGAIIDSRDGVCLAGTQDVCRKFKDFVEGSVGKMQKIHVYDGYCAVQVEGAVARLLMDKLYSGAHVYLDRKYELAMGKRSSEPIQRIGWKLAEGFLKQNHYLGTLPVGTVIFGWFDRGLKGVAAFGSPSSPSSSKTVFGVDQDSSVWELRRFALVHPSEPNLASKFLAKAIKALNEYNGDLRAVISYADEGAGHIGGIYQAIGARYVGGDRQLYAITREGLRLQLGRSAAEDSRVEGATVQSVVRHKYIIFCRRGGVRTEDEQGCLLKKLDYPKVSG